MLSASFVPTRGGMERQCRLLSEWLAGEGVPIAVLTREKGKGFDQPGCPFPVYRIPLGGLGYAAAGAVWLAARGRRFGVLHAHQALSPALAALFAKRLRPRFRVVVKVACSGAWSDFRLAQDRPLYGRRMALLRSVDRFIVLNRESAAELQSLGLGEIPTVLVPNGVDGRRFTPVGAAERATIRSRLGVSLDDPVALFVGRLERRKGIDILLQAWTSLVRRPGAPRLLIAGTGKLAPWVEEAQAQGLDGLVRFLGGRDDVADLYRAADLLVFPSRAEGCPNAVLEAMASGLPVVASDVAGNREVLGEDGKVGRLVPAETPGALADAVAALMTAPALRRELGTAGRARVLEQFDIQRVGARYLSLYEELHG
jgi:glycosyltransferase involved in cell wall biosynthesis